jgi:hypothetical protein
MSSGSSTPILPFEVPLHGLYLALFGAVYFGIATGAISWAKKPILFNLQGRSEFSIRKTGKPSTPAEIGARMKPWFLPLYIGFSRCAQVIGIVVFATGLAGFVTSILKMLMR